MRNYSDVLQPFADKASIGLSFLCLLHCLALPLLVVLLPSFVALGLEDERFHIWLVVMVIPLSTFALTLGCTRHRRLSVLLTGAIGLLFLCMAPLLGHDLVGEFGERLITLVGSVLIAASHVKNSLLCRQEATCECSDRT
ncbi:MerC domain-containing protein [Candidatus Marimicrobium litorale]|uniref:MerC domain-containing protein n=1 Tax=Candidatus Marimicrobium litorale TaxID=2518991 RepID=A0ABT3T122_9GAMM|nr:MerC domain-containing protein [Candidatus Marimicrobium litorale]MCX2975953.1 MerC domain-containing protein [Candidatus Marimicrobium litorale]